MTSSYSRLLSMKHSVVVLLFLIASACLVVGQICELCVNGEAPSDPTHDLAPIVAEIMGIQLQSFTCEQLDSYRATLDSSNEQCVLLQSQIGRIQELCQCLPQTCLLCPGGAVPGNPSFDLLPTLKEKGVEGLPPLETLSCELLDSFRKTLMADDDQCLLLQSERETFRELCDCPKESESQPAGDQNNPTEPPKKDSSLCPMCDTRLEETDKQLFNFDEVGIPSGTTCGQVQAIAAATLDPSGWQCQDVHDNIGFTCGCVDELVYLNADSKTKKAVLALLPVVSGSLSTMGSLYIMTSIWSGTRSSTLQVKDQFLLGMSLFDLISSVASAFSSLAIPEFLESGEPTGIYGAKGNEATCTAQGFFIVLGTTSK